MNQAQAEDFVKQIFRDIWEGHDLNKFDQYYHPEIETNLAGKTIGFSEIRLHAEIMKQTWVNTKVVFKDIISNGDNKIAVRFMMSGTKEDQPIAFEMMGIYELKDNKFYRIFGLSNPPMIYSEERKEI